jgi:hypothetical protein
MEKSADLVTASIAARAKRLYPRDLKARAAYFNAEATRVAACYWAPGPTVRRYGFPDRSRRALKLVFVHADGMPEDG